MNCIINVQRLCVFGLLKCNVLFSQISNGPLPHDYDDDDGEDAINELQFKLDKKNKEFEKVCPP